MYPHTVVVRALALASCLLTAAAFAREPADCYRLFNNNGLMDRMHDPQIEILVNDQGGREAGAQWGAIAQSALQTWMGAISCLKTKPKIVVHTSHDGHTDYDLVININRTDLNEDAGRTDIRQHPAQMDIWNRAIRGSEKKRVQTGSALMLHEMGHAVGLADLYVHGSGRRKARPDFEACDDQTMFNSVTAVKRVSLGLGDIKGVQEKYSAVHGCASSAQARGAPSSAQRTAALDDYEGCVGWIDPVAEDAEWPQAVNGDFDGDGVADQGWYDPLDARWQIRLSGPAGGMLDRSFGWAGVDQPVPGDYDGDGYADIAVYRPTTAHWFIWYTRGGGQKTVHFGWAGVDRPIAADFDGDGQRDIAVFRPHTGEWFAMLSRGGTLVRQFGLPGDIPVPADYDADGADDIAVYRPATAQWFIQRSSQRTPGATVRSFGWAGVDQPMVADYDGDGLADLAVFRPPTGEWFIQYSRVRDGGLGVQFGLLGVDKPVPAHFERGKAANVAVFRSTSGNYFILPTSWDVLPRRYVK